jgi:hypothetical protein
LQVRKGGKRSQATVSAGNKKQKVTAKEVLADLSDDEDLDATANQASGLAGEGLVASRPSRNIRRTRFFE